MTYAGALVVSALVAALLSLALLRVFPQLVGKVAGRRGKALALVAALLLVGLIWFGLLDAHRDLCVAADADAEFHCELSFPLLITSSLSFLVVILSQIPFAASVFAPSGLRHKSEI